MGRRGAGHAGPGQAEAERRPWRRRARWAAAKAGCGRASVAERSRAEWRAAQGGAGGDARATSRGAWVAGREARGARCQAWSARHGAQDERRRAKTRDAGRVRGAQGAGRGAPGAGRGARTWGPGRERARSVECGTRTQEAAAANAEPQQDPPSRRQPTLRGSAAHAQQNARCRRAGQGAGRRAWGAGLAQPRKNREQPTSEPTNIASDHMPAQTLAGDPPIYACKAS